MFEISLSGFDDSGRRTEDDMRGKIIHAIRIPALVIAGFLAASSAYADKPAWAGKGKHQDKEAQDQQGERDARKPEAGAYFTDKQRAAAHEYYAAQFKGGRCPPGLAKKNNGCMPPGQAKKWATGKPLPREVVYYEVPPPVIEKLGPPPSGHRFVRVASDILLIAVGTGMVIDAIEDLTR